MEKCEMLENGYARRIYLQKDSDLPAGYLQPGETGFPEEHTREEGVVLCQIEEDGCRYGQEGERAIDLNSDTGLVCICKSRGEVGIPITLIGSKQKTANL